MKEKLESSGGGAGASTQAANANLNAPKRLNPKIDLSDSEDDEVDGDEVI